MLIIPLGVVAAYLFKTLEARDGLTSSQVNCILKDSRGYMWFSHCVLSSGSMASVLCVPTRRDALVADAT